MNKPWEVEKGGGAGGVGVRKLIQSPVKVKVRGWGTKNSWQVNHKAQIPGLYG